MDNDAKAAPEGDHGLCDAQDWAAKAEARLACLFYGVFYCQPGNGRSMTADAAARLWWITRPNQLDHFEKRFKNPAQLFGSSSKAEIGDNLRDRSGFRHPACGVQQPPSMLGCLYWCVIVSCGTNLEFKALCVGKIRDPTLTGTCKHRIFCGSETLI